MKGVIISIQNDRMEVRLMSGQVVSLPVSSFEGTPSLGQEAVVMIVPLGGEAAGRDKLAQSILNELLRPSDALNSQEK